MALGATIYKIELNVADTDRHHYGSHALTIARHPSESNERMMARIIVFALHADEQLLFTKGLSQADEPDIWLKDLTGSIDLWIEVGQPSETRILKACGRARQVRVYCFNGQASQLWWDTAKHKLERARNLRVVSFAQDAIKVLAAEVQRSMTLHINVQENEIYVPTQTGQIIIATTVLRESRL